MQIVLFLGFFLVVPVLLFGGGLWWLAGLDIATSEYATYYDAAADDLFDRGWLPDFIPASASDIVTTNNLDVNMSYGEFSYHPAETATFLERLRPLQSKEALSVVEPESVPEREANGYRGWEFAYGEVDRGLENTGSVWVFFVHGGKGHVFYEMGPK